MKKFLTLVALFAMALGANAATEWVEDYKIEYSSKTGFPFYVMGYVPEWIDGVMTDFGADFRYETQENLDGTGDSKWKDGESSVGTTTTGGGVEYQKVTGAGPYWHQYFIADGIPTELDGAYTVKAMVKASEACTININMGWSWSEDPKSASVAIGTDWEEIEWEYSGIGGTSCNLVAQPGTSTATIEWKWITVGHNAKEARPVTWQEWLTSDGQPVIVDGSKIATYMGDAETPWSDAEVKFDDQEKNYLICAWSKEKGRNMNEDDGWDPFPADIEEVDGSHVFVCHGQPATTEGDAAAWDNQFWIQSPQAWKSGTQVKLHFRYKASKTVTTQTQIHKQNPSDYLIWHAIGDVTFTEEWQDFDNTFSFGDDMGGGWSIAFNLNANDKDAINFYFDDLSWQTMKLDEGLFIAASNTETGIEYDFEGAESFVWDPEEDAYVATVGTKGDQDSWVNEVMISTVRGNDAAFKGATLKPTSSIAEDEWVDYTEGSLAKIKLPAAGVWKVYIATEDKVMMFEKIEGEANKEPIEINPNPTVVVVNGQERDFTSTEQPGDEEAGIPAGTGNAWDNQLFIIANRTLDAGETTVISFKYRSSIPATSGTQSHAAPGQYIHWAAIGSLTFDGGEEWQEFETTFTIPSECDGSDSGNGYLKNFQSIAFNMAEIKEACVYEIKDVEWYLEDKTESLIDFEGTKNFFVKEGAGTNPYQFGTDPDVRVNSIVSNTAATVIYNLAGQRVNNQYKGIVIKNGSKYIAK